MDERANRHSEPLVLIEGLLHSYVESQGPAVVCERMEIFSGEFFAVIGLSGSGKSTLLRLIAGLLAPTRGRITIEGRSVQEAQRLHRVGVVFQDPALLPWRDCQSNVDLPQEIANELPKKERRRRVDRLLELVKLRELADRLPSELSGGQKQRVAIARALNCNPSILLMDEPFSALDELTRRYLNEELLRIWQETHVTVLFVTHNISEALYLSDRVGTLVGLPGQLKGCIRVPLQRPRPFDVINSDEFISMETSLRRAIAGS